MFFKTPEVLFFLQMIRAHKPGGDFRQGVMSSEFGLDKWMNARGFKGTRMNFRTEGRRGDWEKYGWGQTTPREMAKLLVMIREGKDVSPAAS